MSAPRRPEAVGIPGYLDAGIPVGARDDAAPERTIMTTTTKRRGREPIPAAWRERLAADATATSEYEVAARIGMSPTTLARAMAGLPMYGISRVAIAVYLGEGSR